MSKSPLLAFHTQPKPPNTASLDQPRLDPSISPFEHKRRTSIMLKCLLAVLAPPATNKFAAVRHGDITLTIYDETAQDPFGSLGRSLSIGCWSEDHRVYRRAPPRSLSCLFPRILQGTLSVATNENKGQSRRAGSTGLEALCRST